MKGKRKEKTRNIKKEKGKQAIELHCRFLVNTPYKRIFLV